MSMTHTNGTAERPMTTLDEHLAWVEQLDDDGVDLRPLVETLLREKFETQAALEQVKAVQEELRAELAALCAPEQYPAVITALTGAMVEVALGSARMRVAVHPDVPHDQLHVGARGILSRARNCLLHVESSTAGWHDVGTFEDWLPDRRRLLLRCQEQLFAVGVAHELNGTEFRKGDLVGFDRDGARLAYRKVDPPGRQDLFFEHTPADRFDELGGLDAEIAKLKWVVEFRLRHVEVAARYNLKAKRGILLEGPPGNGKTKLARCLARFVADLVAAGECHFMAIAGSADYSMWLGQSEQRLIARFEAARDLATRSRVPVLMFFDEIDAIGRRRGSDVGSGAPDRILATLLAQLDGMSQVDNLIVVGATNRADVLDPGLVRPGRLGDFKVRIPAPNRAAAGAILARYLRDVPVAGDRDRIVKAQLSRLYAENGAHAEVARVAFRDGSKVVVRGRDLVSGATLENAVRVAAEAAAEREARSGSAGGVTEDDLAVSLDREIRGAAGILTAGNVRGYVSRLPQDRDPVGVEVIRN
jgi:proteasome-associated ATPase